MKHIIGVLSILIATVRGHEDREGFCASVLPTYPTVDGMDIGSFILCECEEAHYPSGQTLSIVVCQYNRTPQAGTGSCDIKLCLFNQNCERPTDFTESELAKDMDLAMFDQWCTNKDGTPSSTTGEDSNIYPYESLIEDEETDAEVEVEETASLNPPAATEPESTTSPVSSNDNPSTSNRCNGVISVQLLAVAIIGGLL